MEVLLGFFILIAMGVGIVWLIAKVAHAQSFRNRGWQYEGNPDVTVTAGLNHPPFGIGLQRRANAWVWGRTSTGRPFQSLRYSWNHGSSVRVAMVRLSRPLPSTPLQLATQMPVHVDGCWLVGSAAPADAATLATFVEHLDALVPEVEQQCAELPSPPPLHRLSFTDRPHMTLIPRDPRWLASVEHERSGDMHDALDIIVGEQDGLRVVGMEHTWRTTHHTTDSRGRRRTHHTHHDEALCEVWLPQEFPDLSVERRGELRLSKLWDGLEPVQFESVHFHQQFTVQARDARFASDVFHPRMLEYLLACQPESFHIRGSRIFIKVREHSPERVFHALDTSCGIFARIPNFVWDNLAVSGPDVWGSGSTFTQRW